MVYAAIEGGGTKFLCAVYSPEREQIAQLRVETRTPQETLDACVQFFLPYQEQLEAIGIACFGPLELRQQSPRYGHILATPKAGWSDVDLRFPFRQAGFKQAIRVETDVNGAVLAEANWGAGKDCRNLVYFTVGTGIGGAALVDGSLLHGFAHPEMGHMRVRRLPEDLDFQGSCPFHGDCLEGLASGPAIASRWGMPAEMLPPEHPAWDLEATYLAQMLQNTIAILAPERIILGGGISKQPFLIRSLRQKLAADLGKYWPEFDPMLQVLPSELKDEAGLLGALTLAMGLA